MADEMKELRGAVFDLIPDGVSVVALDEIEVDDMTPKTRNVKDEDSSVFCQVGVGRFGVSFSPCERRVSGRFGVGRSCWLLVIALVIA